MNNLYQQLNKLVHETLENAFPDVATKAKQDGKSLDPQLVPASKPEFGDFQINGSLTLAKIIKKPPRQIAEAIVNALEKNNVHKIAIEIANNK